MSDLYTEKFEEFWKVYPRRVSKLPAAKAFAKLTEVEQQSAINDVEKRTRARWWSADPRKIPHPATYLNANRFEDEWAGDLKYREEASPTHGAILHAPIDTGVDRDIWGMVGQKVCKSWLLRSGGIDAKLIDAFVKIKNDTVSEMRSVCEEEVEAGNKEEAVFLLGDTILLRLDLMFKKNLRASIMRTARVGS